MPKVLSFRREHIRLVIGGYDIIGFSDADQPISFSAVQVTRPVYGEDGRLYPIDTGKRGGDVTVSLLPTSPSVVTILNWYAQRQKATTNSLDGFYGDERSGYSVTMTHGTLKTCPPTITPNQNFNAVFAFQEIVPTFESGKFKSPRFVSGSESAVSTKEEGEKVLQALNPPPTLEQVKIFEGYDDHEDLEYRVYQESLKGVRVYRAVYKTGSGVTSTYSGQTLASVLGVDVNQDLRDTAEGHARKFRNRDVVWEGDEVVRYLFGQRVVVGRIDLTELVRDFDDAEVGEPGELSELQREEMREELRENRRIRDLLESL